MTSNSTFFEQCILLFCAEAILGNRDLTDAQTATVLSFVAAYDGGELGCVARKTLLDSIAKAISRADDVLTPKPLIVIMEPVSRSQRRDYASTDVMRGFGAGFFTVRKGQA